MQHPEIVTTRAVAPEPLPPPTMGEAGAWFLFFTTLASFFFGLGYVVGRRSAGVRS